MKNIILIILLQLIYIPLFANVNSVAMTNMNTSVTSMQSASRNNFFNQEVELSQDMFCVLDEEVFFFKKGILFPRGFINNSCAYSKNEAYLIIESRQQNNLYSMYLSYFIFSTIGVFGLVMIILFIKFKISKKN